MINLKSGLIYLAAFKHHIVSLKLGLKQSLTYLYRCSQICYCYADWLLEQCRRIRLAVDIKLSSLCIS